MNFFDAPTPNPMNQNGAWMRWIKDEIRSNRPSPGRNVQIDYTNNGAFIHAAAEGGGGGGDGGLHWEGEWQDIAYTAGAIVTVDYTHDELTAGTYVTLEDMPQGSSAPTGQAPEQADVTPILTAGSLTDVTINYGGMGYGMSTKVYFTGDGSGAAGHVYTEHGRITGIVIDSGGSGYTSMTMHFDPPSFGWDMLARGHWQGLTFQTGTNLIAKISSTGQSGSAPQILLTNAAGGVVDIDTLRCNGKRVYLQELLVCEPSGPMHRIFLCSDPY